MRRARRAFGVLCLMLAILPSMAGDDFESSVKAAFVPKFAPFVQWPASAFATPTSAIVLCAQGDDPVTALTERAAVGQSAWGRSIVVRRAPTVAAQAGCHLAYLAGSETQSVAQALTALGGEPVLTVTNNGASGARGLIDFVRVGDRVRFDIDEAAAAERGLTISSKLLSLAREVKRR